MKDLGEVNQLLGCEITRNNFTGYITMSQRKYIREILQRFLDDYLKRASTPSDLNKTLSKSMCPANMEEVQQMKNIPYREAIGCLLWLAMGTRPDIAYAVSQVARYNDDPGPLHWAAVQRIFRYLAGTIDYAIEYKPNHVGF